VFIFAPSSYDRRRGGAYPLVLGSQSLARHIGQSGKVPLATMP